MSASYDKIGRTYRNTRAPDPRIASQIENHLGSHRRILNIGAGTGSYESPNRDLIALEPSQVMLRQRSAHAAPAIQGVAEALPFADGSFDAATILLSLHHWSNWRQGLREAQRVSNGNLLMFTHTGFPKGFWLTHYLPEIITLDAPIFPSIEDYESVLGPVTVSPVLIPHDCKDGFLCAYWRRPEAYLDPQVQAGISTMSKIDNVEARMAALADDLASGKWHEEHAELIHKEEADYGYCLISCGLE